MSSCSHVIFCPTARSLLLVHCKSVCWSNRVRACTYFLCKSSQSLSRAAQNPNHKEYKKDKQANKQNWFWWSDWVFIEDKDNSITPSRGPVWKIWSIINDACDGRREILSVLLDVTQRSLKTAAKIWAGVLTLIVQYFKTKCHFHIKLNGLSFIELYHLSDCYRQVFICIE